MPDSYHEDPLPMTTEMPDEEEENGSDDDSNDADEKKVHPQQQQQEDRPQVVVVAENKKNRRLTISITPPTYPVSIISSSESTTTNHHVPTIATNHDVTPPCRVAPSIGFVGGTPGIFSRGISMQTVFMASSPFKPATNAPAGEEKKAPPPKRGHLCACCRGVGGCCPMVV